MSGAGTRVHQLGSIYTRARNLIKSGALRYKDRPIWYDLYEKFPPKTEPIYKAETGEDRVTGLVHVDDNVQKILYREDWARMQYRRLNQKTIHKEMNKNFNKQKLFISLFKEEAAKSPQSPNEVIYTKVEEIIENKKNDNSTKTISEDER